MTKANFPRREDVEGSSDEVVDVLVSEEFAVEAGLQVGEGYTLFDPSARTSTGNVVRLEIPIRIAGIWIPRTEGGATWHLPPLSFANVFLVPENTYISDIGARVPHALTDVGWYKVVDGDSVRAEDVDRFPGQSQPCGQADQEPGSDDVSGTVAGVGAEAIPAGGFDPRRFCCFFSAFPFWGLSSISLF